MDDLISVIIPVYKVEDYLNRSVNSIIGQTYKNLEIILVDDGSPDRCGEICDEYAKIDDRIRVIHQKNGGLSSARNAGIEIAQGKYLTFLDSDDWVHQEYIERLYQLLITRNSDIAACNFIRTCSEDNILESSDIGVYEFTNMEALEQLTGKLAVELTVAWGKIYNKKLFEDIRYPIGKVHEDEFVAHHLLYKANKTVYTTRQMIYYWQREDSIMGRGFNLKNRINAVEAFSNRADFFNKIGLIKLRDKTYRTLFYIYRQIFENMNLDDKYDYKQEIINGFNELKFSLREGNYTLEFKIFYELYYIIPSVMERAYKIYSKSIGMVKRSLKNGVD